MGFTIDYQLTEPVTSEIEAAMLDAVNTLAAGRTWLSCEPPDIRNYEGVLTGFSKPNFMPHPDDVAAAEEEGLPDGTVNDLLDILCELSRQFDVDWEISHEFSDGPVGFIRSGNVDDEVRMQCQAINDLAAGLDIDELDLDDL